MMQRRLEELEAAIKKLEEDKAELKQENASLVRRERERERRDIVWLTRGIGWGLGELHLSLAISVSKQAAT